MDKTIPAVFGVNRYLWKKITDTGLLNANDYNGLVPIIPTQEEPGFLQAMEAQPGIGSFPYIIYAWNSNGYSDTYWECTDQIVYLISSTDQTKLRDLTSLVTGLFKRYDESAAEINKYIDSTTTDPQTQATTPLFDARYQAYNYKFTSVQSVSASLARNDENQPYRAMLTIKVNYTHADDDQPIADLYES